MSIKFVICGLEHSGTTLLSDIFRQVKTLDSGFEVGVLLGDDPRDFIKKEPFYSNMMGGWKIEEETLHKICQTDSFIDFYARLKSESQIIDSDIKHIFDKTPRYFLDIYSNYEKIKVPFVGLYKDPRSLVYSDYKRSKEKGNFRAWYDNYKKPKLGYLQRIYNNSYLKWKQNNAISSDNKPKIMCASLENICLNTRETLEQIFAHVGYEFKIDYLMLSNLRYSHTRQPQISSRIPFEYMEGLSKSQKSLIENDFCDLEDWFYY